MRPKEKKKMQRKKNTVHFFNRVRSLSWESAPSSEPIQMKLIVSTREKRSSAVILSSFSYDF